MRGTHVPITEVAPQLLLDDLQLLLDQIAELEKQKDMIETEINRRRSIGQM